MFDLRAFGYSEDGHLEPLGEPRNAKTPFMAEGVAATLLDQLPQAVLVKCYSGTQFYREFKR
jgi:hypothetical protein